MKARIQIPRGWRRNRKGEDPQRILKCEYDNSGVLVWRTYGANMFGIGIVKIKARKGGKAK